MSGNIRKYYLFQFFNSLAFFSPVIVLFWQANGLSLTQIMLLQSIYSIGAIILEVPTGAFADHYGKKNSLAVGALFFSMGLFLYGLSSTFWRFALAELTCAAGTAFISGADRSFIHAVLCQLKREAKYQQVEGQVRGLNQIAGSVANVVGGFIGVISLAGTLIATGISTFAAFIVALFLTSQESRSEKSEKVNYPKIITESLVIIRSQKEVLWLTLFYSLVGALVFTSTWFPQPYLKLLGVPVVYFGIIFAILSLIPAFASIFTDFLVRRVRGEFLYVIACLAALSMFLVGHFPSIYIFVLWAFISSYTVLSQTVVSGRVLALVPAHRAATILSFQNFLRRLIYALTGPFIGALGDKLGIPAALQVNALILFLLIGGFYLIRNRNASV